MKKVFFLLISINSFAQIKDWTKCYSKKIKEVKLESDYLLFTRVNIPNFNQLIFSWNAFRSSNGFFQFLVQVRDKKSKKWSKWYKMAEWGNDIQKSYLQKKQGGVDYVHVRLETPLRKMADGFSIKVKSHDHANLTNIKLLNVCTSNYLKFKSESIDVRKFPSIKVSNIPKISQMLIDHADSKKMCSPTSLTMLVSFLLKKQLCPRTIAENVFDHGLKAYGSWPFNTAHAFELCPNYFFKVVRLNSFSELYSYFSRGLPVIVSVRGKLSGAPQEYNEGHIILVIGWDQKNKQVIVHDPAFCENKFVQHRYDIGTFLQAWERSHRLAYIIEKRL